MALILAEKFSQPPDYFLRMPVVKLMFYSQVLRVMSGEIMPERLLDKDDEEMMEYMDEHKEDFLAEIKDLLREADEKEFVGGLYRE